MTPSPTTVSTILAASEATVCRPVLRHRLPAAAWADLITALATEPHRLLALWADTIEVHALLLHDPSLTVVAVSTPVDAGHYPALSQARPNAAPFERMIRDQFDVLYREGAESGRVMAICLHPYITGQPHRIMALKRALEYIDRHPGVWKATGEEIARHFLGTQGK